MRGTRCRPTALTLLVLGLFAADARADVVWVEGEKPVRHTMHPHVWYDKVKYNELSGGQYLSNFSDSESGTAWYVVNAPKSDNYDLWLRANPVQSRVWYKINKAGEAQVDFGRLDGQAANIAADGAVDLRFIGWVHVGEFPLKKGANAVRFRIDSPAKNHGSIDCFVFANEPFTPDGIRKPGAAKASPTRVDPADPNFFTFDPAADDFAPDNPIDLRALNEAKAGDGGFIAAKGGRFVHSKTGEPVRFWAVNGTDARTPESLRREAKILAKRGVNLVRIIRNYANTDGVLDPAAVKQTFDAVEAYKAEGIYTHLFIYFPLSLNPKPGNPWLKGYDGTKHPFGALYFNKDFQRQYRTWCEALLLTPHGPNRARLVDDPAVFGFEIINEDSYLFWTFPSDSVPDAQLSIIEKQYGDWLKARYGSLDKAVARWNGVRTDRDAPAKGRMGLRPPWHLFNEKTARDKDDVRFLVDSQRAFYVETALYLRGIGFKGVISASNWTTASPEILGPLEKYSYTACDFIDRHGYFGGTVKGENAEWSLRDGHVFNDRSALRFDPPEPGKPRQFVHPSMDPSYNGLPSMISETTWTRPNRYRTEAPLFLASYGALQGSDAIVHFTMDGTKWSVKPNFFVQPWTLMTPAMMGQFPAAARIYRQGLIGEGDLLADVTLKLDDLFDLKGSPLPQDAAFDELRLKDVPKGVHPPRPGQAIDPLIHLAGRTNVNFSSTRALPPVLKDLKPYIDHDRQTVVSTNGHLRLDYGKGVLTLNAPAAQGVSGMLDQAGTVATADLSVTSPMPLGHVVAVSLDGKPLATSSRILLQVMSEEKPTGFKTEPGPDGLTRIADIGHDPWRVRRFEGTVKLKRADASALKVTPLDPNGRPLPRDKPLGTASEIRLEPSTLYYSIRRGS